MLEELTIDVGLLLLNALGGLVLVVSGYLMNLVFSTVKRHTQELSTLRTEIGKLEVRVSEHSRQLSQHDQAFMNDVTELKRTNRMKRESSDGNHS